MLAQSRWVSSSRGSEARLAVKDPDVGSKECDILDEYKGQGDGTAVWVAGEATQGLEFGHGDGEHTSVTPLRQKRLFKDLSPPQMSPPDGGDGVISPLKGGSEGRHQSTLPPVLDSGRKESAARDSDVEIGVSEERGRLPDIWDAYAGKVKVARRFRAKEQRHPAARQKRPTRRRGTSNAEAFHMTGNR